jgi:hypothetical protein
MSDGYYNRKEVSNSDLSALKRALEGDERDPSTAYKFGRLLDCMITEPGKIDIYKLECDGEKHDRDDFQRASAMRRAFYRDETCRMIALWADCQKVMIDPCKRFDHDPAFSLPVRCKWDFWLPKSNMGADLKSTTATTLAQFRAAALHFDYDRQRYFYMNIAGSDRDMLIGVSKVNLQVFKIPISRGDELWTSGRDKCLELAYKYFLLFGEIDKLETKPTKNQQYEHHPL